MVFEKRVASNQRTMMIGNVREFPIDIKIALLLFGVRLGSELLSRYSCLYLQKRRAYRSIKQISMRLTSIPQELNLGNSSLVHTNVSSQKKLRQLNEYPTLTALKCSLLTRQRASRRERPPNTSPAAGYKDFPSLNRLFCTDICRTMTGAHRG